MKVFYTRFTEEMNADRWERYLTLLPSQARDRILRYLRWQDRHASLMGKLLLMEALKDKGENLSLNDLLFTTHNRPFFNTHIDFNIAHSGSFVLCAISENARVGIDVEKIQEINMDDLKNVFSDVEWSGIKSAENALNEFYRLWSIKESVLKADGRGLSVPLTEMKIKGDKVISQNDLWYIRQLQLDPEYAFSIASDKKIEQVSLIHLNFYEDSHSNRVTHVLE